MVARVQILLYFIGGVYRQRIIYCFILEVFIIIREQNIHYYRICTYKYYLSNIYKHLRLVMLHPSLKELCGCINDIIVATSPCCIQHSSPQETVYSPQGMGKERASEGGREREGEGGRVGCC